MGIGHETSSKPRRGALNSGTSTPIPPTHPQLHPAKMAAAIGLQHLIVIHNTLNQNKLRHRDAIGTTIATSGKHVTV